MNLSLFFGDLMSGFSLTLALFAVTLIFGIPLGLLISLGSMSKFKPLKYLIKTIVWAVRGTPLILQVILIKFIPFYVFNVKNKDLASSLNMSIIDLMFVFACIAFIINYACYFSEIFRAGIQSIPHGQQEAGQVLGMNKSQIFFKVTLMQVVKRVIPPMSNEIITLVKDTALASAVGVIDLYTAASSAVNSYVIFSPLLYAALFYLIFNGVLTLLFGFIEKKLSYYKV